MGLSMRALSIRAAVDLSASSTPAAEHSCTATGVASLRSRTRNPPLELEAGLCSKGFPEAAHVVACAWTMPEHSVGPRTIHRAVRRHTDQTQQLRVTLQFAPGRSSGPPS